MGAHFSQESLAKGPQLSFRTSLSFGAPVFQIVPLKQKDELRMAFFKQKWLTGCYWIETQDPLGFPRYAFRDTLKVLMIYHPAQVPNGCHLLINGIIEDTVILYNLNWKHNVIENPLSTDLQ